MTDTTTRRPPKLGIIRGTRAYPPLIAFDRLEGSVKPLPDGFQGYETVHIPLIGASVLGFNVRWNGQIEPHADGTPLAVLDVIDVEYPPPPPEPEPDDEPEPDPTPPRRPTPEKLNGWQTMRHLALRAAVEFLKEVDDADEDEVLDLAMQWERWIRAGKDPRTRLEPPPDTQSTP